MRSRIFYSNWKLTTQFRFCSLPLLWAYCFIFSTEQLPGAGSARTSASCSLASSRESSTSAPGPQPYKVLMLGGPAVGKSSLVSQFMTSEYLHAYDTSIGEYERTRDIILILSLFLMESRHCISFGAQKESQNMFSLAKQPQKQYYTTDSLTKRTQLVLHLCTADV